MRPDRVWSSVATTIELPIRLTIGDPTNGNCKRKPGPLKPKWHRGAEKVRVHLLQRWLRAGPGKLRAVYQATSRRTAPFMSVNAAPQLTRVAERIRSGESIASVDNEQFEWLLLRPFPGSRS